MPALAPLALPGDPLPIDAVIPDVLAALVTGPAVVVEAPPGAGKTTRLPLALLLADPDAPGEILVLQPRRLAARMAAQRVAELLGEEVGQRVGSQVRFETRASARTRLRFVTEGILTRRLHSDPHLRGVRAVVLDEFHERHLDGDLALALLRRLQRGPRPDLRLVVMSATLDGQPIADFLGAPRIVSEGRTFPVTIDYQSGDGELPSLVLRAFHGLVEAGERGDVLVFLPGAREIRAVADACAGLAAHAGYLVLPLHGDLPPAEQDRAVRPAPRPKLILATNVAETSITIDGVTVVIDSGLARIAGHSPWTGIPTLQVAKIARASAAQRAGRAGRTCPGRCIRLYSQSDHDRRPEFTPPEIARQDLAGVVLDLHAAGETDLAAFPWYEAPPAAAIAAAELLLHRLGAEDHEGRLTEVGRAMLRFPVHPRLARLLVDGDARGVPDLAAGTAAILGERPLRQARGPARVAADADVLVDVSDLDQVARQGLGAAERLGLSAGACRQALQARDQLLRLLAAQPAATDLPGASPIASAPAQTPSAPTAPSAPPDARKRPAPARPRLRGAAADEALRQALLAAFPDRVAQLREDGNQRALALAGGGAARLAESSVVHGAAWVLCLAIEERREGRAGIPLVQSAAAIEPEWLLDLFPGAIEEKALLTFDPQRARVVGRTELRYLGLLLESSEARHLPPEASALLRDAALVAGPARFADPEALAQLHARTAFVAQHVPGAPVVDDARARAVLAELCEGCTSFAELERQGLLAHLEALARGEGDRLDRFAPTHVRLPGGRRAAVTYALDKPPSLASRLQDFFGMARGPAVADGRVPLVLHLLAPNGRDVQVTTDLAGFWDRHYPALRSALMRRYPRHAWPEDPRTAEPPAPRRPA